MQLIADALMILGAFSAAAYCYVLSRRLQRFQTLEGGLGSAIAVLSVQVDDMTRALEQARSAAETQSGALDTLVRRGEAASSRLELMLASLHDLPDTRAAPEAPAPAETGSGAGDISADRRPRVVRRRVARAEWEAVE